MKNVVFEDHFARMLVPVASPCKQVRRQVGCQVSRLSLVGGARVQENNVSLFSVVLISLTFLLGSLYLQ